MIIYFNSHYGPYGYLSNLAPYDIDVDGKTWRTVEHYFQAQKFAGTPLADIIGKLRKPQDVKRIGSEIPWPVRSDWDDIQEEIMQEAVYHKFASHPNIRRQLLRTGNSILVESSPSDYYWGSGADGSGKNRMGMILMDVRTRLQREERITA
ncbi:MAG: NADAR family protein [Anaerolineales bacterium]|nr:NADAR family protein [Anaerolineales bacterium]